jgi:PAS domain S-box-containing protein
VSKRLKRRGRAASLSGDFSADAEFRPEHALYGQLVEGLSEYAVFALSPVGVILSWNAGAEKTFGYSAAEVLGKSFEIIFTGGDRAASAPQNELDAARNGTASQDDRWNVRKNGTRFWGTNTIETLYDASRTFIGFTKLVRDTTVINTVADRVTI